MAQKRYRDTFELLRASQKPKVANDDTLPLHFDEKTWSDTIKMLGNPITFHSPEYEEDQEHMLKLDTNESGYETHDPNFQNVIKTHTEVAQFFIPSHVIKLLGSEITASVMDRGQTDLDKFFERNGFTEPLFKRLMNFCYAWSEVSNRCKIYYPDFKLANLVFDKDMAIKFIDLNDVITLETLIKSGQKYSGVYRPVISTFVRSVEWQKTNIRDRDEKKRHRTPDVVYKRFVRLHQFYSMVYTVMGVAEKVCDTKQMEDEALLNFFNATVGNERSGLAETYPGYINPGKTLTLAKTVEDALEMLRSAIDDCFGRLRKSDKVLLPVVFLDEHYAPQPAML